MYKSALYLLFLILSTHTSIAKEVSLKCMMASLEEPELSTKEFRIFKNREEVSTTTEELTPGVNYTAVIYEGKLVLGENYLNEEGTTLRTHMMLVGDLGNLAYEYMGLGGAIRVNPDKSIDVAGFHKRRNNAEAAELIAKKIKEALPHVKIRTTPGRLSDLDTPTTTHD